MAQQSMSVPHLRLTGLAKSYGSVQAVSRIDLDVSAGEFVTLLGPSGCGKTTTLMIIAGFEAPSTGDVLVDGVSITHQAPYDRQIGVVFQHAALFPHMTVFDNIAFPLRMRTFRKAEIEARVRAVLDLVKLPGYEDRYPHQLSGGQKQRVAIGRALVFDPQLLLMDEPFAALDRKLREHMQLELKRLNERLKATVIYVTHDQEEALILSDRIAVINAGCIEQIGTPRELYEQPESYFVANFFGECNFLSGVLIECEETEGTLRTENGAVLRVPKDRFTAMDRVTLALRPERVRLLASDADCFANRLPGIVEEVIYVGDFTRVQVRVDSGDLVVSKTRGGGETELVSRGMRVIVGWHIHETRVLAGRTATN